MSCLAPALQACPAEECQHAVPVTPDAGSGQITLTTSGHDLSHPIAAQSFAEGGECYGWMYVGSVMPGAAALTSVMDDPSAEVQSSFEVICTYEPQLRLFFTHSDPRTWTVGSSSFELAEALSVLDTPEQGWKRVPVTITLTVTEAAGRARDYPELVSDDFIRRVRVEFDTRGLSVGSLQAAFGEMDVSIEAQDFAAERCL